MLKPKKLGTGHFLKPDSVGIFQNIELRNKLKIYRIYSMPYQGNFYFILEEGNTAIQCKTVSNGQIEARLEDAKT